MQLTIKDVESFVIFVEMKNEGRIVELLAESLKRQDRHAGILDRQTKILNGQTKILNGHTEILTQHTDILTQHTDILTQHTDLLNQNTNVVQRLVRSVEGLAQTFGPKFAQIQDHETRITRLENRFLKE